MYKLHDVIQLRQQLLHERATLKLQLDKLLQRSVNNVEVIVDDVDDDDDHDDEDEDDGQIQSNNSQVHINQENDDSKSKDTVEQIQLKIKELEKRCALQLLRHEEILLEIEDVRKRSSTKNLINSTSVLTSINSSVNNQLNDNYPITESLTTTSTSSHIDTTSNLSLNKLTNTTKVNGRLLQSGQQYTLKQDYLPMNEINSLLDQTEINNELSRQMTRKQVKGRLFRSNTELQISEGDDPNLVELFQVIEEPSTSTDVPAPRMITLERQLFQSVLISWKAPDINLMNENKIVSAYHIYVDGQFRLAVMSKEKTRALIDNVDADKPHRISIRSISSHGQSKDAQCTLVVGRGMTATPARLKATKIGTKSAKLSWIPGNSNYYHRVYLNECSLHLCKPGVYKLHLTDLPPDTLHRVCVQALPSPINLQDTIQQPPAWINSGCTGVYTQKLAAFIEFRTLPIGLPDPPSHVQIEAGPQDGMLLITWLPVPQDKGAADAVTAAGAGSSLPVQGYTVCLNGQPIMEMNGASRDHAILKLSTIKDHIQRLINNPTQSSLSYDNTNLLLNQSSNSSKLSNSLLNSNTFITSSIIELYITVHSTVLLNSLQCNLQNTLSQSISELSCEQDSSISKRCTLLKGSEGPASKPIHLTACLLIAAAGSLETAYTVFGPNLATKLGIVSNVLDFIFIFHIVQHF
ncbi:Peripheral-type benzodiazepine receptor-associated protein 1 [Schistosoma japonicum]|nr:Peripheral-type benzodiazepine receptor-associated protein 1 [Schistosoma japonicum]